MVHSRASNYNRNVYYNNMGAGKYQSPQYISQEAMGKLYDSMDKRVQALYEKAGINIEQKAAPTCEQTEFIDKERVYVMGNEMIKYTAESGAEIELSPQIIKSYLVNGNGNITDKEIKLFLELCKYQRLNPFLREAYLIKFGDKPATIVTGKEVFTKRAMRNPNFDGMEAGITVINKNDDIVERKGAIIAPNELLIGGWARVYRKDYKVPIETSASMAEYKRTDNTGKPTPTWASMPATMIRKVALVQALREAFPEDLNGLYSQEEMPIDNSLLPQDNIEDIISNKTNPDQATAQTDKSLQGVIIDDKNSLQTDIKDDKKGDNSNQVLTEPQIKRFYALRNKANISEDQARRIMEREFSKSHVNELTRQEYDFMCNNFESISKPKEEKTA